MSAVRALLQEAQQIYFHSLGRFIADYFIGIGLVRKVYLKWFDAPALAPHR